MTVDPGGGFIDKPVNVFAPPTQAPASSPGGFWTDLVQGVESVVQSTEIVVLRGLGVPQFQPDYPPQARALPLLRKDKLQRGYIAQDKHDPLVNGQPLGLRFLYNPTEWEQDYSLDTSRYPTNAAPQAGSSLPAIGVPGASSVAFNLILDRTWDVNNPHAGDPYKKGIEVDVEQFQKMVGYTAKSPFIQAVSLRLVFSKTLSYYGFITGFSVLYSQFTTDMRCYRGGITGITFQVLPDQPPVPASNGATFSAVADQTISGQQIVGGQLVDGTARN